ncbi:MAG: rhomboid family intramembrane serine protease [Erysipelotrichales bacterium]|nr:rhomboid family intramembrane serine protease [Erysipelotrichales bacterium]
MTTITAKDVWQLELTDFFITRYGYASVQVMEDRANTWLFNVSNSRFPVVLITRQELTLPQANRTSADGIHLAILNQIRVNGPRLEICVGSYGEEEIMQQGKRIGLMPGAPCPSDILEIFPDLDKALQGINGGNLQKRYTDAYNKVREDAQNRMFPQVDSIFRKGKREQVKKPYATVILAVMCVVMFAVSWILAQRFSGVYDATSVEVFLGAYYKAFVIGLKEWWRLLTALFMHVNLVHLLGNMMALYYLGSFAERVYGHKAMAFITLVSGIIGNLFVYAVDNNIVGCGMSGGIYGIMGAVMVYYLHTGLWKVKRLRNSFITMLVLNVLISFFPGISWAAHLGGFLSGAWIALILIKNPKWKSLRIHVIASGVILLAGLVVLCTRSKLDTVYFGTDLQVASIADEIGLESYGEHIIETITEFYHSLGY